MRMPVRDVVAHVPALRRTTRARERRASSCRRVANRFPRRRPPLVAFTVLYARFRTPMSELTAMETGSYLNGTDALRSSPLAAPQGP